MRAGSERLCGCVGEEYKFCGEGYDDGGVGGVAGGVDGVGLVCAGLGVFEWSSKKERLKLCMVDAGINEGFQEKMSGVGGTLVNSDHES